MTIKAIITDLDGTLIDFNGQYHKEVPHLIEQLQKKDIQFSLATGKAYFGEVARIISELKLSSLHIVHGGGMIINAKTGETPWHRPISESSTSIIENYFERNNLVFSLETKEYAYMLNKSGNSAYTNDIDIQSYEKKSIPKEVLKILIHGNANKLQENQIDRYISYIKNTCKDVEVMKFSVMGNFGLDVTSENSTKHTAVLEYSKILSISPSEMIAIGDGHNDYPLFTACGYRIAMGNAPKELKEIANKVVATTSEGGMKQALEHIISMC